MTTDHMTGAELQTLREACGLTREEFADMAQVQARTLKHWESGRAGVPADVAALAVALDWAVIRTAAGLVADAKRPAGYKGDMVALVRYKSAQDLPRGALIGGAPGDPQRAALLHGAAVMHARHALAASGQAVRVVWFDAVHFSAWCAEHGGPDTPMARQAWAQASVPAQAIPHRADQPPAA
jgi:transcriptional regulator with XRE-family HTH domain